MPAILALLSAASFGVADFLGGLATRRTPVATVTLISNIAGGFVALALLLIVGGEWSAAAIGYGAAGGVAGLIGLVLLYDALASGQFQIVSPVSAVTGAAVPVSMGIALGDRPALLAALGLVLTPPAIWLLAGGGSAGAASSERPDGRTTSRQVLVQAFLAGIGFGVFFVLLGQTPEGAGAVPLVVVRLCSIALLALVAAARKPARPAQSTVVTATAAGTTDMLANGFFLWAVQDGDLSVVGALTSLYPAGTVVLAAIVLGERLSGFQRLGLALGVSAAALLSI